jgi:hypothetical protein
MRKLIFLIMIVTIAFAACKKDDNSVIHYTSEITINNVKTTFDTMKFLGGSDAYFITNYDTNTNPNAIEIYLVYVVVGDMDFSSINHIEINVNGNSYSSKNGGGKFTVIQKDAYSISGTFSGTFTYNSTEITISGKFSAEKYNEVF